MNPTEEQLAIAHSSAHDLLVSAGAGTGKTSTLTMYAQARPNERMLYLAYNRAIKEDAAKKFPRNVRCVTTHGLAFPSFGSMYQHKLGNAKAYHVAQALNIPMMSAGAALQLLQAWLVSAEPTISEAHFEGLRFPVAESARSDVMAVAASTWKLMQDVGNASVPMPHDGYLKLYQLAGHSINVDRILFDECQDSNPVVQAIVNTQGCGKVYVGDSRQAIYGFRGSTDIMKSIVADEELPLTHSFRFGQKIANLANSILSSLDDDNSLSLTGRGAHAGLFAVNRMMPHTVLSRTNSMLFVESVGAMKNKTPFSFVGGIKSYRFDSILDTFMLKQNRRGEIRDQFVRAFDSFEQMEEFGKSLDDKELKFLCRIVNDYGNQIPDLISKIQNMAIENPTGDEIMLSTGHRAKGLEWDNVILTDDFTDLVGEKNEKTGETTPPKEEEVNLLYVAATRARVAIDVHAPLVEWIKENHSSLAAEIAFDRTQFAGKAQPRGFERIQGSKGAAEPDNRGGRKSGFPWSEADVANLIAMWRFEKIDAKAIADKLERSPTSVLSKLSATLSMDIDELEMESGRRANSKRLFRARA